MRIDGKDAFINRLGRWSDPVAVAKAHAIAAQIWSDYQQGTIDRSLMAYQPLINGKEVGLLEALRVRAETKRQAAAIHAYRLLQRYGLPIRNISDAEGFLGWLRAEGLSDCTIAGLMTHYRQCSGGNCHRFSHKLKWQRRSVQSDVLSVEEIESVLADLETHEPWYSPLFLLWLSTGMLGPHQRACLILLHEAAYGSIPAESLPIGLDQQGWIRASCSLRLEHEFTHLTTQQQLGEMRLNLLDELIADAMGQLVALAGFSAEVFEHCLEHRWHAYVGAPEKVDPGSASAIRGPA